MWCDQVITFTTRWHYIQHLVLMYYFLLWISPRHKMWKELPDKEISEDLADVAAPLGCVPDDSKGCQVDDTPAILLICQWLKINCICVWIIDLLCILILNKVIHNFTYIYHLSHGDYSSVQQNLRNIRIITELYWPVCIMSCRQCRCWVSPWSPFWSDWPGAWCPALCRTRWQSSPPPASPPPRSCNEPRNCAGRPFNERWDKIDHCWGFFTFFFFSVRTLKPEEAADVLFAVMMLVALSKSSWPLWYPSVTLSSPMLSSSLSLIQSWWPKSRKFKGGSGKVPAVMPGVTSLSRLSRVESRRFDEEKFTFSYKCSEDSVSAPPGEVVLTSSSLASLRLRPLSELGRSAK